MSMVIKICSPPIKVKTEEKLPESIIRLPRLVTVFQDVSIVVSCW